MNVSRTIPRALPWAGICERLRRLSYARGVKYVIALARVKRFYCSNGGEGTRAAAHHGRPGAGSWPLSELSATTGKS